MNKGLWDTSLGLVILGLLMIGAGTVYNWYILGKMRLQGKAEGKVVDLELREGSGEGNTPFSNALYPVIEYYAKGKLYKVVCSEGSYPSPYKIGDRMTIRYSLHNPARFVIAGTTREEKIAKISQAAGAALVGIGILIFIRFALRG